jgi:putative transposase
LPAAIDGLLADAQASGLALDEPGGLIQLMIGAVLERALEIKMADDRGYERGEGRLVGVNHRNATGSRRC